MLVQPKWFVGWPYHWKKMHLLPRDERRLCCVKLGKLGFLHPSMWLKCEHDIYIAAYLTPQVALAAALAL